MVVVLLNVEHVPFGSMENRRVLVYYLFLPCQTHKLPRLKDWIQPENIRFKWLGMSWMFPNVVIVRQVKL